MGVPYKLTGGSLAVNTLVLVGLGGAIGAIARYGLTVAMPRWPFPWHTLIVNLLGAALLGYLFLADMQQHTNTTPARALVGVGILGGFTTLSTFGAETVLLWQTRPALGWLNVVANGIGGPIAAWLGWKLAS